MNENAAFLSVNLFAQMVALPTATKTAMLGVSGGTQIAMAKDFACNFAQGMLPPELREKTVSALHSYFSKKPSLKELSNPISSMVGALQSEDRGPICVCGY